VFKGIPRLTCDKYGVFGGVATIGVSTLGVGFVVTFPVASGSSPAVNVASFGNMAVTGVATLSVCFSNIVCIDISSFMCDVFEGVGFPESFPMAS
jgi:hypothetical protein